MNANIVGGSNPVWANIFLHFIIKFIHKTNKHEWWILFWNFGYFQKVKNKIWTKRPNFGKTCSVSNLYFIKHSLTIIFFVLIWRNLKRAKTSKQLVAAGFFSHQAWTHRRDITCTCADELCVQLEGAIKEFLGFEHLA